MAVDWRLFPVKAKLDLLAVGRGGVTPGPPPSVSFSPSSSGSFVFFFGGEAKPGMGMFPPSRASLSFIEPPGMTKDGFFSAFAVSAPVSSSVVVVVAAEAGEEESKGVADVHSSQSAPYTFRIRHGCMHCHLVHPLAFPDRRRRLLQAMMTTPTEQPPRRPPRLALESQTLPTPARGHKACPGRQRRSPQTLRTECRPCGGAEVKKSRGRRDKS